MKEEGKIELMRDAIQLLETAVEHFTTKLGTPLFIAEEGKERFRYPKPSFLHLQVLKTVRIVSSLNALLCLLEKGYVQEMGVLLRTIDDFIDEITFVQEAHTTGAPTADQKRFIDSFFEEDVQTAEERLKDLKKRATVPRKKIWASIARFLGKFSNPDRIRRISKAIDDCFSGYVHGAYSQVMELYDSGSSERFRLCGMLNTPRIPEWRRQVAMYIHSSLNTFAVIALNMHLQDLGEKLIEKREEFEKSEAYIE